MANPADTGTFDIWITNRISFKTAPPKTGSTGDFERWITDRIYWEDYVEAAAVVAVSNPPRLQPMKIWKGIR